ncbi:hypothetical protein F4X33_13170 [Candidatus Poribacteria bacterium]|nr:hypothetical protein [Candidatus Poribacteria bacterium]
MADKTFGYTIKSANIFTRVEDKKYRGRYFYEICLTLAPIGGDEGDSEMRNIWERVLNNLAETDLARRKEDLRKSQYESQDFKYRLPWGRIVCSYHNLLPILYVYGTEPRKIKENRDLLKQLVRVANTLAQKEIENINQERKQLKKEDEELKQLKWD